MPVAKLIEHLVGTEPGLAGRLRDWFSEFAVPVGTDRLLGLMRARVAELAWLGPPPAPVHRRSTAVTVSELEEIVLAAFYQLCELGSNVVPLCDWWLRNCELGSEKLLQALEQYATRAGQKKQVKAKLVSSGLTVQFVERDLDSPAAFSCRSTGSTLIVTLNSSHPAFSLLSSALAEGSQSSTRALLVAWALLETDLPDGVRKDRVSEARQDWGRALKRALIDEGLSACIRP